jgi:hypothetical protein
VTVTLEIHRVDPEPLPRAGEKTRRVVSHNRQYGMCLLLRKFYLDHCRMQAPGA